MVLGPGLTDALNRTTRGAYGAVTGATQTVRNFGGSLGLAILGSLLITETSSKVERTLGRIGVPKAVSDRIAREIAGASGGAGSGGAPSSSHQSAQLVHAVQLDFARATKVAVWGMALSMAIAFVVALRGMPRGRPALEPGPEAEPGAQAGVPGEFQTTR